MALEDLTGTGKFITSLVAANPLAADDRREGDDHIRGVKNVLRNTFPALDGEVSFSAEQMNAGLNGGTNAVQKGGDTMTGMLTLPLLRVDVASGPRVNLLCSGAAADSRLWQINSFSDGNFFIYRTKDDGSADTIGQRFGWMPALGWNLGGASITTNTPSDERWKTCIESSMVKALPLLQRVRLISYRWLAGSGWGDAEVRHDCGFSAQQLMEVNPDFVQMTPASDAQGGRLFVRHDSMVPWLVKALQELAERVAVLEFEARGRGAMP